MTDERSLVALGFLRVAVSNTCRSSRLGNQPAPGSSGQTPSGFEPLLQIWKLPVTHRA